MLIYGRNPVLEALKTGQVETLFIAHGIETGFVHRLEAVTKGVRVVWQPRIELDQLVGTTQHQGVVAELSALWQNPFDLVGHAKKSPSPLLVLLDGITDPQNFGAIIRSSEVLGANGLIVEERRSAPLSAAAIKASAGAAAHLPLAQVKNLPRFIDELKENDFWVYGADAQGTKNIDKVDFNRPLAIVIGAEGQGMRRLVKEKCDELISIAIRGRINSLNASVAAGILLYEVTKHRN